MHQQHDRQLRHLDPCKVERVRRSGASPSLQFGNQLSCTSPQSLRQRFVSEHLLSSGLHFFRYLWFSNSLSSTQAVSTQSVGVVVVGPGCSACSARLRPFRGRCFCRDLGRQEGVGVEVLSGRAFRMLS